MKTETNGQCPRQFLWLAAALIGLFVVIQITGCTSISMPEGSPAMRRQALSFSPPPGMAGVYVIHPLQVSFVPLVVVPIPQAGLATMRESSQINLDYQEFGQVDYNTYLFGLIPPGEHTLGADDIVSSTSVFHFKVEAGKNYYFVVGRGAIGSIAETNGQTYVRQFKLSGDNRFEYQSAPGQTQ